MLRYWLKAVFVPINRPFSVIDSIMNYSVLKLSNYFKTSINLQFVDTELERVKKIITNSKLENYMRIPQIAID